MRKLLLGLAVSLPFAVTTLPSPGFAKEKDQHMEMSDASLKTAHEMVDAWNDLDLDKIAALFTEDAVLHSMMMKPVVGRDTLKAYIGGVLKNVTRLKLHLKNVSAKDNIVFLERVDEFDINGQTGEVPVVGVMVIKDGMISEWREYYDKNQLYMALGAGSSTDKAAKN